MSEVRIHVAVAESLHRAAKITAAKSGRTLKQLVIDGLAHEVQVEQIGAGESDRPCVPLTATDRESRQSTPPPVPRRDVQPRLKGGKG